MLGDGFHLPPNLEIRIKWGWILPTFFPLKSNKNGK